MANMFRATTSSIALYPKISQITLIHRIKSKLYIQDKSIHSAMKKIAVPPSSVPFGCTSLLVVSITTSFLDVANQSNPKTDKMTMYNNLQLSYIYHTSYILCTITKTFIETLVQYLCFQTDSNSSQSDSLCVCVHTVKNDIITWR